MTVQKISATRSSRVFLIKMAISLGILIIAITSGTRVNAAPLARMCIFGMAFSSIGDFFLNSPGFKTRWGNVLPLGMVSFGAAHIMYVLGFIQQIGMLNLLNGLFIGAAVFFSLCIYVIVPKVAFAQGNPVRNAGFVAYAMLVCSLCVFAAGAAWVEGGIFLLALIGSALFVISDSLIMLYLKRPRGAYGDLLIWITYGTAQLSLVFTGFIAKN